MSYKIGILGGTFNPVHFGHINLAKVALKECNLSKIIFLPNGNPPHKDNTKILNASDRYRMLELAIKDIPCMDISDYEIKKDKPSYTIDTYRYFKTIYDAELYFIIGADSLYTINTWKSYEELLKICKFIVLDRTSPYGNNLKERCDIINKSGGNVYMLNSPTFEVTSSDIRNMIKNNKDVSTYLPKEVINYIKERKLYI